MKQKKIVRVAAAALAVLMILTIVLPLFAQAETAADEYNRLQQELNNLQNELTTIGKNQQSQKAVAANAKKQVVVLEQQITALGAAIQETEAALAAKTDELEKKKQECSVTEDLFKQRLRAMYMMRGSDNLATLLGAQSFSELLTSAETLRCITLSDTDLLKRLGKEKDEIAAAEQEIRTNLEQLEADRAAMETKKTEYAAQLRTANATLTKLEADQKATAQVYSATYGEYLAAKAQVEGEFTGSEGSYVGGAWAWPVPGYQGWSYVSSPYGWRTWDNGYTEFHTGIDIARGPTSSIYGAAIVASNSGYVLRAKYNAGGYGYYVMLDHGGNIYTLYGHCSSYIVSVGQYVAQGQTIAYVGSTGNSTGPHLHFEIRMNGSTVDPAPLLGLA